MFAEQLEMERKMSRGKDAQIEQLEHECIIINPQACEFIYACTTKQENFTQKIISHQIFSLFIMYA